MLREWDNETIMVLDNGFHLWVDPVTYMQNKTDKCLEEDAEA